MQFPLRRRRRHAQGSSSSGRRRAIIVRIITAERIFPDRMRHVAEGTPAVPAVLLRVLAVHFAAFVDLDLVLDQLGIVVQLLQLDVPEELLEAAYSRLLVRRCRHRGDCAWQ
jgi:hypothetical protein